MNQRMTPTTLKLFVNSADFKKAWIDLQMCRDTAKRVRAIAEPYLDEIFKRYRFVVCSNFRKTEVEEVITSRERLYLADLESRDMKLFDRQCWEAHRANGFDIPEGHCPICIADNSVIEAESRLIALAAKNLDPCFADVYGDKRERLLQLLTTLGVKDDKHATC